MLDTIISPNNYAYQFRVDILPSASFYCKDASSNEVVDVNLLRKKYMTQICKLLTQEEFVDWVVSFEISPSGKHHYQCILWHSRVLSTKDRNSLKSKYFRTNRDSKNSISFTCAKKVINLSSYVFKDHQEFQDLTDESIIQNHDLLLTTLKWEQINLIPKWLTKEKMKAKWKQDLEDEILLIVSKDRFGHYPTKFDFAKDVLKFHIKNDKDPPHKARLFKLALKYLPTYTEEHYLVDIGFLQSETNYDYANNI